MTESNATSERELITPSTPEAPEDGLTLYTIDSSPSAALPSLPAPQTSNLSRSSSISSDMNKTAMSFDKEATNTASSSLEFSEDVLRMDVKGFTGFVERVPLWIKLLVMTFVCAVGLVAVGSWLIADKGISVSRSSKSLQYISFATIIKETSQKCQAERRITRRYFNGVIRKEELIQFYATSTLQDEILALLELVKQMNSMDNRLQAISDEMTKFEKQLPTVRQDVTEKRTSAVSAFFIYTGFTTNLLDFVSSVVASSDASQELLQHLFFLKLRDTQGQAYAFMQLFSNSSSSHEFQHHLSTILGERDASMALLKQMTTPSMLASLNTNIASQNYLDVAAIEKTTINLENSTTIKLPPNFSSVEEGLLAQYDTLVAAAAEEIRATTTSALNEAIVGIVVVVVFSIIILIGSLLVNFCVSSSVIGPWKRLNMLQELTMAKFVPRQFLHLLKCNRITDVTLGKNAVRDNLFIVQFSIHDFHKVVKQKNMNHDQTIQFINSFLMYYGEVARTFGGYIDRYYPDGFICLFTKSKNAIKCTTEMHRCIELYNTKVHSLVKPVINASISLVKASQTLIGAVGENDRIQPVLVSEDVAVAHKLINLAYKYKAGMIIAKSVKTEFSKSHKFRLLGRLLLSDGNHTNIYELVDGNCPSHKLKTYKDFSAGVKSMLKHDYTNALTKLDQVVKESKESDDLAKYLRAICYKQVERNKVAANQLIVTDTLRDPTLREVFTQYCQQERSVENIHMWALLEDFKAFATFTSRHLIAQKVLSQYLSNSGDTHVNLSAEVRNKYKLKVEKVFSGIKSPRTQEELMKDHFFRGLQAELELVMNDTHARFKATETFQKAFSKSKHSSQPSCVISTMSESLSL